MPTLYLTRPGITPPPVFGHVITIPPAPTMSQQPDDDPTWLADILRLIEADDEDALMHRLGHTALLAGVGKPDHVQLRRRRTRRVDADAAILQADLDELTQRETAIIGRVRSWLEMLGDVTAPGFWKKLLSLLGSDGRSEGQSPTKLRVAARVRASTTDQTDEANASEKPRPLHYCDALQGRPGDPRERR